MKEDEVTPFGVKKNFDASGANRSLELIGKHLKLFTDKVEHSGEMKVDFNLEVFNESKRKLETNKKAK